MSNPEVHTISVQELKKRQEDNPALCLIDVRENDEWEEGRIPGAIHIPKDQIVSQIEKHVSDPHQPIYLHCRAGARSLYAARCLVDMGYQEVYSVNGGISEWEMCGYPVDR